MSRGFRSGLSLNPLFDELTAGRGLPEPDRVPALYAYLVSDRRTASVHPLWDAPRDAKPDAPPPLESIWAARDAATVVLRSGDVERSVPVARVRDWALESARVWHDHGSVDPETPRVDRDIVVRFIQPRDRDYARRLAEAAALSDDHRVVVGAVGAELGQWVGMSLLARLFPGLGLRRIPVTASYSAAIDSSVPGETTGRLCVVGPRSDLAADEIRQLLDLAGSGRAAAPVELDGDGTIASVGAIGTGTVRPYRLLGGHPAEDAQAFHEEVIAVPLLTGPTFALSLADWALGSGLEDVQDSQLWVESLTDRLRQVIPAFTCVVATGIVSTAYAHEEVFHARRLSRNDSSFPDDRERGRQLLEAAQFDVSGWSRVRDGSLRPRLRWRRPSAAAMRWAIKVSAPPGPAGAVWGDTHFAHGLAKALRRLGQTVVIDSFPARNRPSTPLDDVALVIRGPYRIKPPRGGIRIEWIISHPDEISRKELQAFDKVFAASHKWSLAAAAKWGVRVTPMLACTDADQFFPRHLPRSDEIVFVGTARGIARPSVVAPLDAGIPVRVYGPDWRTHIPASAIVATSIPNSELSARYETASVVLNDQWPAMRREGFIAMRPFDVVAAGGRVISEYVDGIEAVFGDVVPVFHTSEELVRMLRQDPRDLFPVDAVLLAASERIRRDHSFDARAAELLRAAQGRAGGSAGG